MLWTALSGYLNACLKELAGREGVELFVSHNAPDKNAPYAQEQFGWIAQRYTWRNRPEVEPLQQRLEQFQPEIMVIAGWHIPAYRKLARLFRQRSWRVMIMDNPWRGTVRQRIGSITARLYVKPIADAVWLPGERQSVFAQRLSFGPNEILRGSFSCDQPAFDAVYRQRIVEGRTLPHAFLFVGRFVPAKGVKTLVEAYARYRAENAAPWPLICCGAGPLQALLEGQPGIEVAGFIQPEQMASVFASAACLVLPSEFEPWALVVHEATSAGLLVLASERVGAAVHLVQPGYNGFVFAGNDVKTLAEQMRRVSAKDDRNLEQMSEASHTLSLQYSPRRWADTLLEEFSMRRNRTGMTAASAISA